MLFLFYQLPPPPPPKPPPENPPPPEPLELGALAMAEESDFEKSPMLLANILAFKAFAPMYHEGAGGFTPMSFMAFASLSVTPKTIA